MSPASKTRHWNTPAHDGKTRCGRHLGQVVWRNDIDDVDCNSCIRLYDLDQQDQRVQEEMQKWRSPDEPYKEP